MGQVYSPSHEESDNMFIIEHPNKYVHISFEKKKKELKVKARGQGQDTPIIQHPQGRLKREDRCEFETNLLC